MCVGGKEKESIDIPLRKSWKLFKILWVWPRTSVWEQLEKAAFALSAAAARLNAVQLNSGYAERVKSQPRLRRCETSKKSQTKQLYIIHIIQRKPNSI